MDHLPTITLRRLATLYNVTPDFLASLEEYELIQVTYEADTAYVHHDEIAKLERMIRLNHDLGINVQGLCVVRELIEEREAMRAELARLRGMLSGFL